MREQILRQGEDYTLYGRKLEDGDFISSLVIYCNEKLTVCFPVYDMRRQWKRFFKRPSFEEAQETWIESCLAGARSNNDAR